MKRQTLYGSTVKDAGLWKDEETCGRASTSIYTGTSKLELGADILRTAVAPTWAEIRQFGALRTALNFFLQQEINKAEARRTSSPTVMRR